MTSSISIFHSEKGGVGKSICCKAFIYKLMFENKKFIVIDADQSNADVHREFLGIKLIIDDEKSDDIEIHQFDLGEQNGWWDLYNLMNQNKNKDTHIVISMPAQIEFSMFEQRKEFKKALDSLGYKLNMIWMLSEAIDSIQLLKHTSINNNDLIDKLIIVKNGFFADENEFLDWQNSNIRKDLLKNENNSEVFLPELNKRLKRALKPIKKPFAQALTSDQLDFSERMGLEAWLDDTRAAFSSIT